ncbi:MAG: NERD domain-containing protein [Anaerolineales bacterium]|nr:NERD domain-containing protein [Anaerolineales bacterium]
MTVEFWIGQEFDTTHERHALKRFLDDMQAKYGHSNDTYFILANFSLMGKQIDLTVLKRDAIIVIDLKERNEPFRARENGPWLTLSTHREIKGSDKQNPLEQVKNYRKRWMSYLNKHQSEFLAQGNSMDRTHTSAIVAISPTLHPDTQDELPYLKWFHLVGLDDLPQTIYEETSRELNFSGKELRKLVQMLNLRRGDSTDGGLWEPPPLFGPGRAPPLPPLVVGRDAALQELKSRIGLNGKHKRTSTQVLTAVHGWPGVGKTTLAAMLAHDRQIITTFGDGVLWTSLGEVPNLLSELTKWGDALKIDDMRQVRTLDEASTKLTAHLRDKRMLLIVDDVWKHEHAVPFQVGGKECATLITTRLNTVARVLAARPDDVYKLDVLSDTQSLKLLKILASTVVEQYPEECLELIHDLEGLPLALQVAGHLLNAEASLGFSVADLLTELREGRKLIEAQAPADRADVATQTTPTVAALLKKSTDCLDEETRDYFAFLGAFAPRPATFDLEDMAEVWGVEDAKPIVRELEGRGLLEPVGGRFWMHALLVMHAKSMLEV